MTDVNRNEVFEQVRDALVELFEIDAADITPEAQLYQELDLDSIDAVDLVVHLQNLTGKKIKPEEFKSVRSVNDVVDAVIELLKES
ncbi:acyl carrier protein [Photobacterium swingsii]|uniref:Acyl carrier protein n=2 Tax=Photobacterium TaxID=657 RepID=A0AAW7Y244_9GAMM|nr:MULTISPECIES: acyl carrier protein [Photobacterium]KMV29746.1 acyl carrier protein [Photobacterium swingsii]KXI21127.1 acyl carrier protein [Photobacterium sanguinicancri]MDO6498288.1 acyl carrier protein [Photobacterium sanguinicancri]MDO6541378.1 acyl carrier protein [Photobacterium sanguinicancri]OZS42988.1 acyl carrier protein [Photobacterium sanguinicancri]